MPISSLAARAALVVTCGAIRLVRARALWLCSRTAAVIARASAAWSSLLPARAGAIVTRTRRGFHDTSPLPSTTTELSARRDAGVARRSVTRPRDAGDELVDRLSVDAEPHAATAVYRLEREHARQLAR